MAYNKYDSDKQAWSYMDGIPVKISEQFKPPKKITLPGAVLNKLNADIVIPEYDFTLEKSIMDKMSQWRNLRSCQREARRERIEAEKQTSTEITKLPEDQTSPTEPTLSPPSSRPYTILTPVPINASTNSQSSNHSKSFNISDFEQDTATPFDNMELKTINDLEELAHVLQPTVISDKNQTKLDQKENPSLKLNGFTNLMNYNDRLNWTNNYDQVSGAVYPNWYQDPPPTLPHYLPQDSTIQSYVVQRLEQNSKSVPDIVQQLELELRDKREAENRRSLRQPQRPASIGPAELSRKSEHSPERSKHCMPQRVSSTLPNPYAQLPVPCQQLTDRLAEMGFPPPRVARATEIFGDDETKVVEFLVQVQMLEEMSYPPDRAEKALIANDYKQSETVEYLKTLDQLLDLGFREELVVRALSECGSDRDKALDQLIS